MSHPNPTDEIRQTPTTEMINQEVITLTLQFLHHI